MSIGCLGVKENKKHAAALYPIIQKYLGVDEGLCYIHFTVNSANKFKSIFEMCFHHLEHIYLK